MIPTVHWLGGWATSLVCWEPMLRVRFPDFEHRFLDAHALLDKAPTEMGLLGGDGGAVNIVAAWSMGSLLAHRWIEQGLWPPDLPLLSLCPIFRFLRPEGFGEPVLLRMERKLATDRDAVLRDFWRRMPKAEVIPAIWEESWFAGTRNHSNEDLIKGLEFLRGTIVELTLLRSIPRHWELLMGDRDLLAPDRGMEALASKARRIVYEGGHLPFWECPEVIHACLYRLSSC